MHNINENNLSLISYRIAVKRKTYAVLSLSGTVLDVKVIVVVVLADVNGVFAAVPYSVAVTTLPGAHVTLYTTMNLTW